LSFIDRCTPEVKLFPEDMLVINNEYSSVGCSGEPYFRSGASQWEVPIGCKK